MHNIFLYRNCGYEYDLILLNDNNYRKVQNKYLKHCGLNYILYKKLCECKSNHCDLYNISYYDEMIKLNQNRIILLCHDQYSGPTNNHIKFIEQQLFSKIYQYTIIFNELNYKNKIYINLSEDKTHYICMDKSTYISVTNLSKYQLEAYLPINRSLLNVLISNKYCLKFNLLNKQKLIKIIYVIMYELSFQYNYNINMIYRIISNIILTK